MRSYLYGTRAVASLLCLFLSKKFYLRVNYHGRCFLAAGIRTEVQLWTDKYNSEVLVDQHFEEDQETVACPFGEQIRALLSPYVKYSRRAAFFQRFRENFGDTGQTWDALLSAYNGAVEGYLHDVHNYQTGNY